MTLDEYRTKRDMLDREVRKFSQIKTSCTHCMHYDLGHCKSFDAAIPASFAKQVDQCSLWVYDEIPF